MNPFEEELLFACLPAVHAYKMLNDPAVASDLTSEGVYNLSKAAGFTEESAQYAARERALTRLRNEQAP